MNEYYQDLAVSREKLERLRAEEEALAPRQRKKSAEIRTSLERIVDWENARILDLGCGRGGYGRLLAGTKGRVVGLDLNLPELLVAGDMAPDERFCYAAGNGYRLPFKSESFDLVLCRHTIEHLREPEGFLRETRRTLRSSGVLYLSTPNRNSISLLSSLDGRKWLRRSLFGTDEGVYRVFSLRGLTDLALRAGYSSPIPLPLPGIPALMDRTGLQKIRPSLKVALRVAP